MKVQNTMLTRLRMLFIKLVQDTDYYNCSVKEIFRLELALNLIMCVLYDLRFKHRLDVKSVELYGVMEKESLSAGYKANHPKGLANILQFLTMSKKITSARANDFLSTFITDLMGLLPTR